MKLLTCQRETAGSELRVPDPVVRDVRQPPHPGVPVHAVRHGQEDHRHHHVQLEEPRRPHRQGRAAREVVGRAAVLDPQHRHRGIVRLRRPERGSGHRGHQEREGHRKDSVFRWSKPVPRSQSGAAGPVAEATGRRCRSGCGRLMSLVRFYGVFSKRQRRVPKTVFFQGREGHSGDGRGEWDLGLWGWWIWEMRVSSPLVQFFIS